MCLYNYGLINKSPLRLPFSKGGTGGGDAKSLSLNKLWALNPPLKKGEIGGFALRRLGKIPPPPLYKGGNAIYGQALRNIEVLFKKADTTLSRKRTERNPGIPPKSF
jgi:hypothetical protein